MHSQSLVRQPQSPRAKLFWAVIVAVALAQVAALVLLCRDQMQKAAAREASVQAQRMALSDCLQYVPNSTIGSCTRQRAQTNADTALAQNAGVVSVGRDSGVMGAGRGAITSVVPVSFAYR